LITATYNDPRPDGRATAVLLIHGIGEQRPYETLDLFVKGLAREMEVEAGSLEHRLTMCGEKVVTSIRLPVSRSQGPQWLDVYEFHWAGMVEGRIRLHQVLAWLVRTALTPLRRWSHLVTLAREAGSPDRLRLWGLIREVGRSVALVAAVLLIATPFVHLLFHGAVVAEAGRTVWTVLASVPKPLPWAVFTLLLTVATAILLGYAKLARWLKSEETTERSALQVYARYSAGFVLALIGIAIVVQQWFSLDVRGVVTDLWSAIRPKPILFGLAAAGLAFMIGRVLVRYVGDIALYTTADENSGFFRTRERILNGATTMLRSLCNDPANDAVFVAGHSLGSVIGYDAINRVVRDSRVVGTLPGPSAELSRLKGLLTFGSPLDLVYYFFRTTVDPVQPVRAQVLSSLHSFRKRASGRQYGQFQFARYALPPMDDFAWINVYSSWDVISRRLAFYEVDQQVARSYPGTPARAHLAYWGDRDFYRCVFRWLGGREEPTLSGTSIDAALTQASPLHLSSSGSKAPPGK
jgi:hypothetical protein